MESAVSVCVAEVHDYYGDIWPRITPDIGLAQQLVAHKVRSMSVTVIQKEMTFKAETVAPGVKAP